MRIVFLLAAIVLGESHAALAEPVLPDPAGCRNYQDVKTGVADPQCDAAIASETDARAKSTMLFRRAYIKDATGNFDNYDGAIADLTEAIRLDSTNFAAYHERAYLYNELGRWQDALNDIDKQIMLFPTDPRGYQERSLSRFELGDLDGSFRDTDTDVKLVPTNAKNWIARAQAELWLGRFDDAEQDVEAGSKLANDAHDDGAIAFAKDVSRQISVWRKTSDVASPADECRKAEKSGMHLVPTSVGDCTKAFLEAATPHDRADALTVRAVAFLMLQSDTASATADRQLAVAFDPNNAGNHSNLAFSYMDGHHSTAAVWEFNRAIAIEPSFYAYAGRAAAYANLGKHDLADADARKSLAIKPNDLALTILGDLSFSKNDLQVAKTYWLQAYDLGDRDDGLKARFEKVGMKWSDARQDPTGTPDKSGPR